MAPERKEPELIVGPRWWVESLAKFGVPTLLLAGVLYVVGSFTAAVAPEVKTFLSSAARQLDVVSESVPKMQASLEQIVKTMPSMQFSIDNLEREVRKAMESVKKGG